MTLTWAHAVGFGGLAALFGAWDIAALIGCAWLALTGWELVKYARQSEVRMLRLKTENREPFDELALDDTRQADILAAQTTTGQQPPAGAGMTRWTAGRGGRCAQSSTDIGDGLNLEGLSPAERDLIAYQWYNGG